MLRTQWQQSKQTRRTNLGSSDASDMAKPPSFLGSIECALSRDGIESPDALGGPKASPAGLDGVLVDLDRQRSQAVIAQPGKSMASIRENGRTVLDGNGWDEY
jgi:hypothetical protein